MKSAEISTFLSERIAAGDFPSAVYLVAERGEIVFEDALGAAVKTDEIEIAARLETIYDLASLTKVLVTGLLCARLFESDLDVKISRHLREFDTADKREITVGNLLAHNSGLAGWLPFYLLADDAVNANIAALIAREPLAAAPNGMVKYSDLNFILLGLFIAESERESLAEIAEQIIFKPLGLSQTTFNPPASLQKQIAACEFGNGFEKQLSREMNFAVENRKWREELIWGAVHDSNSYFMGGETGHAGLFSTASEVFKIALQFLPATTKILKPEICELFKTNLTENSNEARSFAFELAATPDSTASAALSKNSFGHLGFTGTSLWIEPETERIFILLTNRIHRPLPFVNINSTRREFHTLATQILNETDSK